MRSRPQDTPNPDRRPAPRSRSLGLVEIDMVGEHGHDDVVDGGEGGQQVVALEDESDGAPVFGEAAPTQRGEVVPVDLKGALVAPLDRPDEMQHGRLSGPAGSGECDDGAGVYVQRHVLDGDNLAVAGAKALTEAAGGHGAPQCRRCDVSGHVILRRAVWPAGVCAETGPV